MHTRARWAVVLPTMLTLLVGLGAAPALATSDEDFLTYSFTSQQDPAPPDGATNDGYAIVACQGSDCRLVHLSAGAGLERAAPTFEIPGSLTFTAPASGDCAGPLNGPTDVDLTFTDTTITGTVVAQEHSVGCSDGGTLTSLFLAQSVTGTLTDGGCHFEPGGCGAASAASPEPPPGAATAVVYDVTIEHREIGSGGAETLVSTGDGQLELRCAEGLCAPVTTSLLFRADASVMPFAVPGTYSDAWQQVGQACDRDLQRPGSTELIFSATGVTGGTRHEVVEGPCPGGGTVIANGTELTIVDGALVEGGCWFTIDGCAPPAVEDEAGGADADVVTAAGGAEGSAGGAGTGSSSRLATGDPAAPSVLSALAPPAQAGIAPQQLLLAAIVTIILVLLMAFPTSLLNSAIDGASDRFAAWRERRGAAKPPAWRGSWWWAALGVLAAALISAFVDPQFGANPGSLRMLLSIAVSFAVEVVLGWVVLMWLMRRLAPGATRSFSFRPLSLLIVVLAVVFTRSTGFEPGIVFGLVAGLGFATTMGVAEKARTTLVPLGYAFGLGIAAWFAYGAVADASGDSVGMTLLAETLSSLTVGGMVALPLALVPIKGMSGHTVWQADRRLWAGSYAVGLFAFFVVLLPMPTSWAEVGWELWAWIGVYVAYATVAIVAWLVVKRPWRTDEPAVAEPAATAHSEQEETPAPILAPQPKET